MNISEEELINFVELRMGELRIPMLTQVKCAFGNQFYLFYQ